MTNHLQSEGTLKPNMLNITQGLPVGNFGIAGEVSTTGQILSTVVVNPPEIGVGLKRIGGGGLYFKKDDRIFADYQLHKQVLTRIFPECRMIINDPCLGGITAAVDLFAPISSRDSAVGFLSCIIIEVCLSNETQKAETIELEYKFLRDNGDDEFLEASESDDCKLVKTKSLALAVRNNHHQTSYHLSDGFAIGVKTLLPPGKRDTVVFMIGYHHDQAYYAAKLKNVQELITYVGKHLTKLKTEFWEFVQLLPTTGDSDIDSYLRWYLSAGILLTKGFKTGDVLTMGYCELNQRDSYWTSWLHLIFWPDLEKKMIRESLEHQGENGKIPTTILPVIEREDDIDINEYFILRVARYYEWHRDLKFLKECWPGLKKAVLFLIGLDQEGQGLPMQKSFWGDWKDVRGISGRKYAPHFILLWLAVLDKASQLAKLLGEDRVSEDYQERFQKVFDFINKSIEEGGMWNGQSYADIWNDHRKTPYVLHDQCVGAFFNMIAGPRLKKIYDTLNNSETDWGIRETYPYIPNFDDYAPGDYHNGGVWVFLQAIDACGRYCHGYPEAAERLLKKIGSYDLAKPGDYLPNEYLDGETAENKGPVIQGWNAAFLAAIYFGAFGLKRISDERLEIRINIPDARNFATKVRLPEGFIMIERTHGELKLTSGLNRTLQIGCGQIATHNDSGVLIGDHRFEFEEFTLLPGGFHVSRRNS